MLSVNALIITFALPLLGKEIADNRTSTYSHTATVGVCLRFL